MAVGFARLAGNAKIADQLFALLELLLLQLQDSSNTGKGEGEPQIG